MILPLTLAGAALAVCLNRKSWASLIELVSCGKMSGSGAWADMTGNSCVDWTARHAKTRFVLPLQGRFQLASLGCAYCIGPSRAK